MPKLSVKKRKELKALANRPDEEIDLSDIPEIQEIPSDAVIGKFYRRIEEEEWPRTVSNPKSKI